MNASPAISAPNSPADKPEPVRREPRPAAIRAAAILLVTTCCVVFAVTGWVSPVRVVCSLAFLLFVPGLALTELLEIRDLAQRLAIATPASLGLATLPAVTLVYAGAFSVTLAIAILATFTVSIVGLALLRTRRPLLTTDDRHPPAA